MKKYNVVILGATGAVGIEFRKILLERKFPIDKIKFLGLTTVGKEFDFGGRKILSEAVADGCFKGYDIGLFSAGGDISKKVARRAVKRDASLSITVPRGGWTRKFPWLSPK